MLVPFKEIRVGGFFRRLAEPEYGEYSSIAPGIWFKQAEQRARLTDHSKVIPPEELVESTLPMSSIRF